LYILFGVVRGVPPNCRFSVFLVIFLVFWYIFGLLVIFLDFWVDFHIFDIFLCFVVNFYVLTERSCRWSFRPLVLFEIINTDFK